MLLWWSCPRAPHRWTLRMPCTRVSGTVAGAPGWTVRWCRSTHRCKTDRRWRYPPSRKAAPHATGSMLSWATSPATAPKPRCEPGSTPRPRTKPWPVGVSVHRADCSNFREMAARSIERVIDVEWGSTSKSAALAAVYPVDVAVEAADRQGLLRDISEVFAREKTNVIGVQTQSVKGTAWMTFTVEVADSGRLNKVLGIVAGVPGVRSARRR